MASATVKTSSTENVKSIFEVGFSRSQILQGLSRSSIIDVVPFRVRFTSIIIPGRSPLNVPGIGLQIIGYSNYIL
jgi:hypothetical protein